MGVHYSVFLRNDETRAYVNNILNLGTALQPGDVKDLDDFVTGTKALGLWNNMVCWPLRSIHNIGTGSTVYGLGGYTTASGTKNATLYNNMSWSTTGFQVSDTSSYINFGQTGGTATLSATDAAWVVTSIASSVVTANYVLWNGGSIILGSGGRYQCIQESYTQAFARHSGYGFTAISINPGWNSVFGTWRLDNVTSPYVAGAYSTSVNTGNAVSVPYTAQVNAVNRNDSWNTGSSAGNGNGNSYAFVSLFFNNSAINTAALHNLYKSTIGKGLGLP